MVAAKAVSKSREIEKCKSAARTCKWRERQSVEQSKTRQVDLTGHTLGRPHLSEEQQSEIQQDDLTGHIEGRAHLSEEQQKEI